MFAEDISEDFSEDRIYHFLLDFKVFLDIFEIFTEACFLLRSFRKFLPSGFLPLSRFQGQLSFQSLHGARRTRTTWSAGYGSRPTTTTMATSALRTCVTAEPSAGKLNLRTGAGWRAFYMVHMIFLGK